MEYCRRRENFTRSLMRIERRGERNFNNVALPRARARTTTEHEIKIFILHLVEKKKNQVYIVSLKVN